MVILEKLLGLFRKGEPFTARNHLGVTYYLNMKEVSLRGGKLVSIWYFTIDLRPETVQRTLPIGYEVRENPRNGFLTVKRIDQPRVYSGEEDD